MDRRVVEESMRLVDFLGDLRGPLLDAAGDLRVQRLPMKGVSKDGREVGLFLRVDARFSFCAHRNIVAGGGREVKGKHLARRTIGSCRYWRKRWRGMGRRIVCLH